MAQHGDTTALHFLNVAEASRLIAARALSPVELVEAFLGRIEAVDGQIHSYITVLAERAARRRRRRRRKSRPAAGRGRCTASRLP